ncbi:MAG: hypothetical protein M3Y57_18870 [Acidobacteriota bacterium]|nr:hypothetical protein [Acidobacteriota bacterium]
MGLTSGVYAAGSIATGVVDLIWGDFEAAHQPIQAFSDHIPDRWATLHKYTKLHAERSILIGGPFAGRR